MNLLIVDPSLSLRSFSLTDADTLFNLVNQHKSYLGRWMNWVHEYSTPEDARAFIRFCTRSYQEGNAMSFGIWDNNALVGEVSFTSLDKNNDVATIGYWLAERFTGKGYVNRSLTKLIAYGFEHLGINRMEIRIAEDNAASINVANQLGFERECILKSAGKNQEGYHDVIVFSKLAV